MGSAVRTVRVTSVGAPIDDNAVVQPDKARSANPSGRPADRVDRAHDWARYDREQPVATPARTEVGPPPLDELLDAAHGSVRP